MSERGVFAVHRGIFNHPIFADEPFTEREAWIWLCSEAAWKNKRARVGGRMVDLERGQLTHSERYLATKWQWSKSRVHRFLRRLKSDAMLDLSMDHETNLITICNYDKYAFWRTNNEPFVEPQSGPAADQQRTKEEEGNKGNKEEKILRAVAHATRPVRNLEFEEFWKAYPRRQGANPKHPARKKFEAHVKSGVEPRAIIAAARRYADDERKLEHIRTPYVAQAVTWLNQRRFDDYQPQNGGGTGPPAGMTPEEKAAWAREQMKAERANVENEEGKNGSDLGSGSLL